MKKIIAIILEIIPIVSVIAALILFISPLNMKLLLGIFMVLAAFGFQFFLFAYKLYKSKLTKILGIIDVIASLVVIAFYIVAIFSFGL
jgi:hypothetical protein